MWYANYSHKTIQTVRKEFQDWTASLGSVEEQATNPKTRQMETALSLVNNAAFKIVHPLLIRGYKMPSIRYREEPMKAIGVDIETKHDTGAPRLLGFYYPDPINEYTHVYNPSLEQFFGIVKSVAENGNGMQFITWGNLDLQAILRLFDPSEEERKLISRGISANVKNAEFVGDAPVIRYVENGKTPFYVAHYISGRSLRLAFISGKRERSVWFFNMSQFYPGTIAKTAKGLHLDWRDFPENTHLVDWKRFSFDRLYRNNVLSSNKQDARIVSELGTMLQDRFYEVFQCYPSLLVSPGSLTDAAVGKMLADNPSEYNSNSWRWLVSNVWKGISDEETIAKAETLLAECFSAGYVDQFAVGFFPKVYTADIAAAYPHKIRSLPDLRYSRLFSGAVDLDYELSVLREDGWDIETAIIRGLAHIPDSLKFHPITIKTFNRENYRPTGTFYASYTLEEREYCRKNGATFEEEEYIIVTLSERHTAPIGRVSSMLGDYRAALTLERNKHKEGAAEYALYDGQQYMAKIVDNSLYGKTVMTTEVVENINGTPQITGYMAGDRFNLLYGTLITARTRIQIARACTAILESGGRPIMTMTDSIYWEGELTTLPAGMVSAVKTPGYFEEAESVKNFYILKTGQYEYQKDKPDSDGKTWTYRMRGLNVDFSVLNGKESFYRRTIQEHTQGIISHAHPKDIAVPVKTRRLVTIGSPDLEHLAMVQEGTTQMLPFMLSSKQAERHLRNWKQAINGHVWLSTPKIEPRNAEAQEAPLAYLKEIYEKNVQERVVNREASKKRSHHRRGSQLDLAKRRYIIIATRLTGKSPPPGRSYRLTWAALEEHYGKSRKEVEASEGIESQDE